MKALRLVAIVGVCLAATFGTAFAVTKVVHDDTPAAAKSASDSEPAATPDTKAVNVIAPIASARDGKATLAAITKSGGKQAKTSSVTVSGSQATASTGVTDTSTPSLAEQYAGPGPAAAAAAGAIGAVPPAFVDPCAGAEAGDGADEDDDACGTAGIPGTIVPAGLTYLWVEVITMPERLDSLDPGWRRCSFPTDDGLSGGAPIVVVTSQPVDAIRVTTRDRSQLAGGPSRRTFDVGATSTSERSQYTSEGYDPDHWYRNVQHCLHIVRPASEPEAVSAHASITTPAASADSSIQWLIYSYGQPQPPVQISFEGANTMHVVTPVRGAVDEATNVTVIRADGSDGPASCSEFDTDPVTVADTLVGKERRSVGEPLDATAYTPAPGFDSNYNKLLAHTLRVQTGTAYFVCIVWSTQPASFDQTAVHQREQWQITSPNRPHVVVSFDGLDLLRGASGLRVTGQVNEPGGGAVAVRNETGTDLNCVGSITIDDTRAGLHRNPHTEPFCDPFGYTDDLPGTVDLVVRIGSTETRSRVVFDPSGGSRSDTYAVALPDGSGRALFRADYDIDTALPVAGSTTPDGAYEARAGLPPVPGPTRPQLDFTLTGTAGGRVARTNVRPGRGVTDLLVDLVANEAADAHVFVTGYNGVGAARACLRAGGTGDTRAHLDPRRLATVSINGLCAGTEYFVNVELTDRVGNVALYAPWGTGTGTDTWFGFASTNVYRGQVNLTLFYNRANRDDLHNAHISVGNIRVNFSSPGREGHTPPDPVFGCLTGVGSNGVRYLHDVIFTEQVSIVGHASSTRGRAARETCHLDNPTENTFADAEALVNVEDLLRAGRQDIHLDLPDGPTVDFRVEVAGRPTIGLR